LRALKAFILNYWRGSCGFGTVAGLGFVFLAVWLYFPFALTPAQWGFPTILAAGIISFTLAIWLAIGAFRTGDRLTREGGGMILVWASFAIAGFGPFGASILTFQAALRHALMVQPVYPLVLPLIPFAVTADGREIALSGDLDFPLRARFLHTLALNPTVTRVALNSNGGNVFAARALVLNIQAAGLATRVDQRCFSSCTLVFMAGQPRLLGATGELGFHGYRIDSKNRVQTLDVGAQEDKDRAFFASKGVTPAFIDRIFATPPSELWRPGRDELRAAGVIGN